MKRYDKTILIRVEKSELDKLDAIYANFMEAGLKVSKSELIRTLWKMSMEQLTRTSQENLRIMKEWKEAARDKQ